MSGLQLLQLRLLLLRGGLLLAEGVLDALDDGRDLLQVLRLGGRAEHRLVKVIAYSIQQLHLYHHNIALTLRYTLNCARETYLLLQEGQGGLQGVVQRVVLPRLLQLPGGL